MSTFSDEFTDMRTNSEFNTFVTGVDTYQDSQEYTDSQTSATVANLAARRTQMCNAILSHFNNDDQDNFDTSDTDFTLYVGDCPGDDLTELQNSLLAKGYTTSLNSDSTMLTISSST